TRCGRSAPRSARGDEDGDRLPVPLPGQGRGGEGTQGPASRRRRGAGGRRARERRLDRGSGEGGAARRSRPAALGAVFRPGRVARPAPSGEIGPSNEAQLRRYLRRMRAGGAGIADEFLRLLERALRHYGIGGLSHDDALERAVLRLFASQRERVLRHRTVAAVIRLTAALAAANGGLEDDRELAAVLSRIARLRVLVPDTLADLAIETGYALFEAPEIERQNAAAWRSARAEVENPPHGRLEVPSALILRLAAAPWSVFERIASWISGT